MIDHIRVASIRNHVAAVPLSPAAAQLYADICAGNSPEVAVQSHYRPGSEWFEFDWWLPNTVHCSRHSHAAISELRRLDMIAFDGSVERVDEVVECFADATGDTWETETAELYLVVFRPMHDLPERENILQ